MRSDRRLFDVKLHYNSESVGESEEHDRQIPHCSKMWKEPLWIRRNTLTKKDEGWGIIKTSHLP